MPSIHKNSMNTDSQIAANRLARARLSLEGLSVGDTFGEKFFTNPDVVEGLIQARALPSPPWHYTDDTLMALSVFEVLRKCQAINQDLLAGSFANHYDRFRGYGPAMHRLLGAILDGEYWQQAAASQFNGQGSYGNGSAMRVSVIGAYFADNLALTSEQAVLSAVITHTHEEAIAGAIAVAIATAIAWQLKESSLRPTRSEFLDLIYPHIPASEVKSKIRQGRDLPPGSSVRFAVSVLGNGVQVSAQDTVPFTLWCAGEMLHSFEEALWLTVSGLGDRDTTCAIVGGIVVMYAGEESIPKEWLAAREQLPEWAFI